MYYICKYCGNTSTEPRCKTHGELTPFEFDTTTIFGYIYNYIKSLKIYPGGITHV